MIYPDNFEQKIGIDIIRQLITKKCLSTLGEEKVKDMDFSTDFSTIAERLDQSDEFLKIIYNKEDFPTDFYTDVRDSLHRIGKDITIWFSEDEISALMNSLHTINNIVHFLQNAQSPDGMLKYPVLASMAGEIKVFPEIVEKANSILDRSNKVKDNASRRLWHIRRDKTEAVKSIARNMQAALRNAQAEGIIGKDVQPSLREGHMLIPVNASNKRKIKGIIHDSSGSGKTTFIEPEAVAEASNRLRQLEIDERHEVVKILTGFADCVRPHISDIINSYNFLAEIDFIRAKALFAVRINAIKPIFELKQQIDWSRAIHPLLNIQLRQQRKQAHPLDIRLNSKDRLLIVSGANAGGKSLCLKTVALLQYMLQCGLPIPVDKSSVTGLFENIFIDIGDGQSIENSLSTYTAHLSNMKFIVENCNSNTLILIDEFGSGTEPQIGGAIAETLLDRFNRKLSFGVITTHFQNLKYFAYETDGIVNGAMLYDSENMKPLYKLSIGSPGSSFAIEVARKIGLAEDIIIDSSSKIGEHFINMDKFLQSIARDKIYWEAKHKEFDTIQTQKVEISGSENKIPEKLSPEASMENTVIEKGDNVRMNGQSVIGEVLDIRGKKAVIAFGSIKMTVLVEHLELISKKVN